MNYTKARAEASKKYKQSNEKRYTVIFHAKYDKNVIEVLESVPNRTDYIRKLILKENGLTDDRKRHVTFNAKSVKEKKE